MLAELRLEALDRLDAALVAADRAPEATPEPWRRTASQPVRERTHALLAEALARAGRQAEALRVIADFRRCLGERSGLETVRFLAARQLAARGTAESTAHRRRALFDADLTTVDEQRITPESCDMRQMVITGFRGDFPGDNVGLDTADTDFVTAFTMANELGLPVEFPQPPGLFVHANNRQDIVFTRETPSSRRSHTPAGEQATGSRAFARQRAEMHPTDRLLDEFDDPAHRTRSEEAGDDHRRGR